MTRPRASRSSTSVRPVATSRRRTRAAGGSAVASRTRRWRRHGSACGRRRSSASTPRRRTRARAGRCSATPASTSCASTCPRARSTTTSRRRRVASRRASSPGVPLPSRPLPPAWMAAPGWSVVPVAGEVRDEWAEVIPADAHVAVAWQGFLRDLRAGEQVAPARAAAVADPRARRPHRRQPPRRRRRDVPRCELWSDCCAREPTCWSPRAPRAACWSGSARTARPRCCATCRRRATTRSIRPGQGTRSSPRSTPPGFARRAGARTARPRAARGDPRRAGPAVRGGCRLAGRGGLGAGRRAGPGGRRRPGWTRDAAPEPSSRSRPKTRSALSGADGPAPPSEPADRAQPARPRPGAARWTHARRAGPAARSGRRLAAVAGHGRRPTATTPLDPRGAPPAARPPSAPARRWPGRSSSAADRCRRRSRRHRSRRR